MFEQLKDVKLKCPKSKKLGISTFCPKRAALIEELEMSNFLSLLAVLLSLNVIPTKLVVPFKYNSSILGQVDKFKILYSGDLKPSILRIFKVSQAYKFKLLRLEVPEMLINSIDGHNVISNALIVVLAKFNLSKREQLRAITLPNDKH